MQKILGFSRIETLPTNLSGFVITTNLRKLVIILQKQIQNLHSILQNRNDKNYMVIKERLANNYAQLNDYVKRANNKYYQLSLMQNKNITNGYSSYKLIPKDKLDILFRKIKSGEVGTDFLNALLHSIIKVESAFIANAKSTAGASGIMQIMPKTAKRSFRSLVGKNFIKGNEKYNVMYPYDNLVLGATHTCELLDTFHGNIILVSAAYNCGSRNLNKWIANFGRPGQVIPAFVWIELVPFAETRDYIKKIIEEFVVYTRLLGTRYLQHSLWSLF
jgi:soluble lytic murein transglycosylase-like protein